MIVDFDAILKTQKEQEEKILALETTVRWLCTKIGTDVAKEKSTYDTNETKNETADECEVTPEIMSCNLEWTSFVHKVIQTKAKFVETYGCYPKRIYISSEMADKITNWFGAPLRSLVGMRVCPDKGMNGYEIELHRF